ncbi:hypothetical protein MAC_07249 [Metarhizium acridum CQMa 102]|uniref:Uncharacterized protein n=1 Tax=Metarhizium acridum (strain CQMa 102) TaxID=655827 RepID=E9EBK1_METAQ|nr:uncharacterized protein MAC_07249 [Metarhizium acridum CQMa 102]EFY86748.1 hypothetical protein MAC_07249 [Metarhizium acridum CQMa 102]
MFLSNAAVLLLLGALQPALGKPAIPRPMLDGSKNEIASQWLTATETVINYLAPNPGCGANVKAWVGVWSADACNPYTADFKAWSYVEPTQGDEIRAVKFNNAELGIGEYKAAFVCEDGRRQPWMVSQTFKVDGAPPARNGQCVHRRSTYNNEWTYTSCDKVKDLCFDCAVGARCIACEDCKKQCGNDN